MIQDIPETAGAQEDQPRCPAATTTGQAHATGNAMGRRAWKKTSVGLRLSKNTKGLEKWISAGSKFDVSILELGMRSLDHSESKQKRQGLVGLGRLVQFLLVIPKMSQA